MLYKFLSIILINFFILENVKALENTLSNEGLGKVYIIGGTLGHDLNNFNNNEYDFILKLEKKYNLINLSIPEISIYDQLNLLDSITNFDQNDDKIIFILENFYLESIFFEINYIKNLCENNKIKCKKLNLITYKKLYLPLIDILHKRVEDYFSFTNKNNVIFLVDNRKINYTKYNLDDSIASLKNKYFNKKNHYCVISEIDNTKKISYDCSLNDL
jgi:hypothetical protein